MPVGIGELGGDLRDPEIRDVGRALLRDEDVVRGDVAMHEAERLAAVVDRLVCGVERLGRLAKVEDRIAGAVGTERSWAMARR